MKGLIGTGPENLKLRVLGCTAFVYDQKEV